MKTTLTLSIKKEKTTDVNPQILVFCNGELVDEVVIEADENFKIESDFEFVNDWNEINYIVNDMCWSSTDGPSWSINFKNLEVDDNNRFPISRGPELSPVIMEFNPADVVLEIENYDETSLDRLHYQQVLDKPLEVDCSFGFCFKVEDDKVVDHYHANMDHITASPTLNINSGTFLKLIRMSMKKSGIQESLDSYLKLTNDSTLSKFWSLPIILKPIEKMDLLVDACLTAKWTYTRVYRQFAGQKITREFLVKLLLPPTEG